MKRCLPAAVLAALVLAACGGSSYGREDAIEAMVDEAGFPAAFAECVADGAEDHEIPWDAADESLNDENGEYYDDMQTILIDCDAAVDDDADGTDDEADDAADDGGNGSGDDAEDADPDDGGDEPADDNDVDDNDTDDEG